MWEGLHQYAGAVLPLLLGYMIQYLCLTVYQLVEGKGRRINKQGEKMHGGGICETSNPSQSLNS